MQQKNCETTHVTLCNSAAACLATAWQDKLLRKLRSVTGPLRILIKHWRYRNYDFQPLNLEDTPIIREKTACVVLHSNATFTHKATSPLAAEFPAASIFLLFFICLIPHENRVYAFASVVVMNYKSKKHDFPGFWQ